MSGEEQLFNDVTRNDYGLITFGENSKVRVIGMGFVSFASSTQVEEVLLVEDLKHNLLSISQLCDEGNVVIFDKDQCIIKFGGSDEVEDVPVKVEELPKE